MQNSLPIYPSRIKCLIFSLFSLFFTLASLEEILYVFKFNIPLIGIKLKTTNSSLNIRLTGILGFIFLD